MSVLKQNRQPWKNTQQPKLTRDLLSFVNEMKTSGITVISNLIKLGDITENTYDPLK